MSKKMYIISIILVVMSACHPQKDNSKQADAPLSIELSIYPSGGGEFGYTMMIEGQLLKVLTKELKIQEKVIVLGKTKEVKDKNLSTQQLDSLTEYVSKLKELEFNYKDADLTLDTWVFNLVVDGKQVCKFNSFVLSKSTTPKKIKEAIKYIINLSPFKIDLHGFS